MCLSLYFTCHQNDGLLVGVQLHLPSDPRPVEVSVPPALLLALRLLVLVSGTNEGDPEVPLLPVHGRLDLSGRDGRGHALLGCDWTEESQDTAIAANHETAAGQGTNRSLVWV